MSTEAVTTVTSSSVVSALQKASAATGTDFDYLLKTAMRESGLKPTAKAASSSASGLFQFVEQTWLGMIKNNGEKYGLGSYSAAITKGSDGRYRANSPEDRQAILDLRSDPQVSALMAGEYAAQCKTRMQTNLGRDVGQGELYAAHFLGPDAACKLISLNDANPNASAAGAFPQAAEANRSVFYRADGSSKSVAEVYAWATRQGSTPHVAVADTPTVSPASTTTQADAAMILAQFQTHMLTSALLSDGDQDQSTAATTNPLSGSPLQLSYGLLNVLSAMGDTPRTRG